MRFGGKLFSGLSLRFFSFPFFLYFPSSLFFLVVSFSLVFFSFLFGNLLRLFFFSTSLQRNVLLYIFFPIYVSVSW